MEPESKPVVYIPMDAKINLKDSPMPPPPTVYEKRKAIIPREEIKKQITKRDIP